MSENNEMVKEAGKLSVFAEWKKYYTRWIIFGFLAGSFQPVLNDEGGFWIIKLWQALTGIMFGFACAVVFTWLQNKVNYKRDKYRTWGLIFVTWMGMKFVLAGFYLAL